MRLPAMPPEMRDRVLLFAKLGSSATVRTGRFRLKTCVSGFVTENTATCPESEVQKGSDEWPYHEDMPAQSDAGLTVDRRGRNPVSGHIHADVEHRRRMGCERFDELTIQAQYVQLPAMCA